MGRLTRRMIANTHKMTIIETVVKSVVGEKKGDLKGFETTLWSIISHSFK